MTSVMPGMTCAIAAKAVDVRMKRQRSTSSNSASYGIFNQLEIVASSPYSHAAEAAIANITVRSRRSAI
jgi:hypothetical protein